MDTFKILPPLERVRELFSYNPHSGELLRGGKKCGYRNPKGYLLVSIDGSDFMAHRVIWLIHYGEDPCLGIDHKDRDKSNNSIKNLRLATKKQNCRNTNAKGYNLTKGRYQARIMVDGKMHNIGLYKTEQEASDAYQSVKQVLHADFAS